ncbi:MAG: deoxyguanosinetriphosphate triphosphohydrolase [Chloroflexi bacterium]|nr:deoxyguanosinetriphosphate triphosphohydrolase [Chloroflexota bacterium]
MLLTREAIEKRERKILASYALKSGDSRGRVYPGDEATFRTAFQRDRDRILHNTAFRRLEYKTQVFVNHEGDDFRTRLTHTLEVTQIGRTIARTLGANEDLVEAICLVHDIGHPPFGHSGEYVLDRLMKDHGGFEHNQQALRVVTLLERRYPDYPGLNLTYEVREGIVKHETEYDHSHIVDDYDPNTRASLEAQIANVADEIAYTAHDLDDGLAAGLLVPEQLNGLALWDRGKELVDITGDSFSAIDRHKIIRRLISLLVTDLCEATHERIEKHSPKSPEDIQKLDENVVTSSDEMAAMARELKDYLYKNMYNHYRVVRMAKKAERYITEMFEAFISTPEQLPTAVQNRVSTEGTLSLERAVCDYIAGMTDRFALEEYQKLFEPFAKP